MSVAVDYTALLAIGKPHLTVVYSPAANPVLRWTILNGEQTYSRAATFEHAVAFIRAAERNDEATVDEESIQHYLLLRETLEQYSVRVEDAWALAQETDRQPPLAEVIPLPAKGA